MQPTLFIAGDSTAAIKGGAEKPMAGWGEFLQPYFGCQLTVENHAINGRSTKSFLAENRLDYIEKCMKSGDYLFIQFGHNDQKKEDPTRYTHPYTQYSQNLLHYIEAAHRHHAIPVLLTSVSRRKYNEAGELDPQSVGDYPMVTREVAASTNTALLDIFTASQELYCQLGKIANKQLFMHLGPLQHPNYPGGITDNTHFSLEGAGQIAKLVVTAISQNDQLVDLQQYIQQGMISV
jgi:lysophospholipase L1-like esterase